MTMDIANFPKVPYLQSLTDCALWLTMIGCVFLYHCMIVYCLTIVREGHVAWPRPNHRVRSVRHSTFMSPWFVSWRFSTDPPRCSVTPHPVSMRYAKLRVGMSFRCLRKWQAYKADKVDFHIGYGPWLSMSSHFYLCSFMTDDSHMFCINAMNKMSSDWHILMGRT